MSKLIVSVITAALVVFALALSPIRQQLPVATPTATAIELVGQPAIPVLVFPAFLKKLFKRVRKWQKKIFGGIKKVFKKVWKSDIGKIAIIAAAIFTGGAALAALGVGAGGVAAGGGLSAFGSTMAGIGTSAGWSTAMGGYAATGGAIWNSVRGTIAGHGGNTGVATVEGTGGQAFGSTVSGAGANLPGAGASVVTDVAGNTIGGAAKAVTSTPGMFPGAYGSKAGAVVVEASKGGGLMSGLGKTLGSVGRFAKNNPIATLVAAQGVGSAMSNYSDQKQGEEARDRYGAGFKSKKHSYFNRQTGRFELVDAADPRLQSRSTGLMAA